MNIAKRSHLVCRVMCMHIVCLFDGCCTCVFIHICKQFIFVNNSYIVCVCVQSQGKPRSQQLGHGKASKP